MAALDPVSLSHAFAADPGASGKVDTAELDAQLALLKAKADAHSQLISTLLRDSDLQLRDRLIRIRNLHDEVAGHLQLIAQASSAGFKILPAVTVASTANLTLSGTQTIDGVACIAGNRVLAKDQTLPAENGVWVVAAGAWDRASDAATWSALQDAFVWVDGGTANGMSSWSTDLDDGGTIDIDPVAVQLAYRAVRLLADMDPSTINTASLDLTDYILFHDVATGELRRALASSAPYLPSTTTHGDLAGLADDDHPQYLKAAGDTLQGDLDADGHTIKNLPDPVDDDDAVSKAWVQSRVTAAQGFPVGTSLEYNGTAAPDDNWMVEDGSAISRTDYAALFLVIGTHFGSGDGTTTFNIPNSLGRAAIGAGAGGSGSLTARALAATGGAETHTLTITEMPSHHHANALLSVADTGTAAGSGTYSNNANTADTGGGGAHENMMPYIAKTKIIRVKP